MKKKFFLMFLGLMVLLCTGFMHGAIPAAERAALIALYNSTGGDSWENNSGWKNPPLHSDGFALPGTEGSWYGVTILGDKVEHLALTFNNLVGSLPGELGNLSQLKSLLLYYNTLSGSIPAALGKLGNLVQLSMSNNQLSGSIPPELGNLSQLNYLNLFDNQLSGSIPATLGNLSNLKELFLGDNQLTGSLPTEFGNLNSLTLIDLSFNQLSGSIPSTLGNLHNLTRINFYHNQFSGSIPPELGNLTNLDTLSLEYNQLTGSIPAELGNLLNVQCILLGYNQLSGEIPKSLTNLEWLFSLGMGIYYNCLTATDPDVINWLGANAGQWEATQCLEKEPPIGSLDTPLHGATVSGSIAVTGWTLDDRCLENVKLYIQQGRNQIFIGEPVFIEGSRPDVEAAYPTYPDCKKAGWGYMLLTNMLPNGGNGSYLLVAIATDQTGKTKTIGTARIYVNNASSVKPFGAIDKPGQGENVYVGGHNNSILGWVLTPQPNSIPTDGSTIDVWIDSANNIGHPAYNIYREDVASLFPNYANSNGACAFLDIPLSNYAYGMHTIHWTVTDSAGNTESIGGRYFTIVHEYDKMQTTAATMAGVEPNRSKMYRNLKHDAAIDQSPAGIQDTPQHTIKQLTSMPEAEPMSRLVIKQLGRIEFKIDENATDIQGYVLNNNRLNPLPIGSTLDPQTGTFYWIPGPGFLGKYLLVFVITDGSGQSFKKSIEIEIKP